MRTNTKTFEVLKFIGSYNGIKPVDVEKFIVTHLNQKPWSPRTGAGMWKVSLYGYGSGPRRKQGIYDKYCVKVGDHWFLNTKTADIVKTYYKSITKPGDLTPKVFSFAGPIPLENSIYRSDAISASGGSTLHMPQLPEPKIIREVEYVPLPPVKEPPGPTEFDHLTIEELELEAIKVLRETRAALKVKQEEYNKISKELLDAKLAEKEAASVLRQALKL